jgi:DNA-binding MarR family transcriptional regulator
MTEHPAPAPAPETVRWLTPTEQDAWRQFLDATRDLLDVLDKRLSAEASMPLAYYDILVVLSEAPDHALRMGELARRLRCSSSRLTHALTRLEANGWARRESTPADRRGAVAVLTPAGHKALAAAAPGHVRAVRQHVIDTLSAEQIEHLAAISRKISRTITSATDDGSTAGSGAG